MHPCSSAYTLNAVNQLKILKNATVTHAQTHLSCNTALKNLQQRSKALMYIYVKNQLDF